MIETEQGKKDGFIGQRTNILPADLLRTISDHPLCEGLYITDMGYYPQAALHARERLTGISQHILIYCTQGEGSYSVDHESFEVKPHQFFLLPAGKAHSYRTNEKRPWSIYWIHFMGSQAEHYIRFLQSEAGPVSIPPRPERFVLFEEILSHLEMSYNLDNLVYANASLTHFLVTFKNSVYNPRVAQQSENDPISRSLAFMKQNLDKNLTLEELAQVAGMSASHFSSVFRQKVQSAPVSFFTYLKIQQACQLLEYTTLRIKEVAYQMGYPDPYHFSRVFTQIMGTSPREFRKTGKA